MGLIEVQPIGLLRTSAAESLPTTYALQTAISLVTASIYSVHTGFDEL